VMRVSPVAVAAHTRITAVDGASRTALIPSRTGCQPLRVALAARAQAVTAVRLSAQQSADRSVQPRSNGHCAAALTPASQCTAAGLLRQGPASRRALGGRPPPSGRQRRLYAAPSRPRCWRTAVAGPVRAGGQAAHARAGRGAGGGRWTVWWQRAPTPLVRRCAPRVGRAVLHWPGCVPRIGTPWKASHGRGGLAGGRSSGAAPLACLWPLRFPVLGRPRKVISARSCVKARPRYARCYAALTPARSDWLRGVRTDAHIGFQGRRFEDGVN
jgi:hypothetical protein